jgi:hypothetical protein
MKTSYKCLILACALASGFALAQLSPVERPPAAQRQATVSPAEQYRVMDTAMIPVKNAKDTATAFENTLNELGAEGWRVRAGAGNYIILAR